ncbi:MAG: hypothetical protein L0Y39_06345, partial [Methylococcaceae bacterium]|nr:hypothetical protein [Methylococcaceae bacterium]
MKPSITRRIILGTLALLSVSTAGYAAGGSEYATSLNKGLANAFHSVGQNVFGSAAFGVFVPPNPVTPSNPMRLDFAHNIQIPVALTVFVPPDPFAPVDPCRAFLKVELTGGVPVVKYDPNAAPAEFSTDLVAVDLSAVTPNT